MKTKMYYIECFTNQGRSLGYTCYKELTNDFDAADHYETEREAQLSCPGDTEHVSYAIKVYDFTFDVHFNDDSSSSDKGFVESFEFCKDYITHGNGTNLSYFPDYKGGTVSIVCNETGETVYEEEVTGW